MLFLSHVFMHSNKIKEDTAKAKLSMTLFPMFVGGGGQAYFCAPCERQSQSKTIIGSYLLAWCKVLGPGELKRQGQK